MTLILTLGTISDNKECCERHACVCLWLSVDWQTDVAPRRRLRSSDSAAARLSSFHALVITINKQEKHSDIDIMNDKWLWRYWRRALVSAAVIRRFWLLFCVIICTCMLVYSALRLPFLNKLSLSLNYEIILSEWCPHREYRQSELANFAHRL